MGSGDNGGVSLTPFGLAFQLNMLFLGFVTEAGELRAGEMRAGDLRAGEYTLGTGGAVTIDNGASIFVMALEIVAENDLDRGRAARKPGRGPAELSLSSIGLCTGVVTRRTGAGKREGD